MNKKMIRQAQELQKNMMKMQQELESATVEATAGGGAVTAVVSGKMRLESLQIDPEAVTDDGRGDAPGPGACRRERGDGEGPGDGQQPHELPHRRHEDTGADVT